MASISPPPPDAFSQSSLDEYTFNFTGLPSEIRDLIWEATLPSARIFHVCGVTDLGYTGGPEEAPVKSFKYHVKHHPPIATQVCRGSRAVALRNGGFFLTPHQSLPGPWFSSRSDILYFDRNQRHLLRSNAGRPTVYIRGWDQVLNVGVEWRAWFRDIPQPTPGPRMKDYWRVIFRLLHLYMPNLKGIHYILPRVRHKGGVTWGREPFNSHKYPCKLMSLPEETTIPWSRADNFRTAINLNNGGPPSITEPSPPPAARPTYLATWKQIQQNIEVSLRPDDDEEQTVELDWMLVEAEEEEEDEKREADFWLGSGETPYVAGWWLLRCGAPREDNPNVKDFVT